MVYNKVVAVMILYCHIAFGQIAISELTKIGVIQGKNYALKITGDPTYQLMVIKLLPNLGLASNCSKDSVDSYKDMLSRVLKPISETLNRVKSYIKDRQNNQRFWGAIVGGVAMGIATSAQITAGVALHNSIQNANAISSLKDSIRSTNQAIELLQTAQKQTVVAISALQDQINTQIIPVINQLSCEIVKNTVALKLNQYFSELSLIFGPNLRDPASETLSIQALSRAFNGDFDSLLLTLGYNDEDFLDLVESHSIRGRIIDVALDDYYIAIQIEYPNIITIPDAIIQSFNIITYMHEGVEWQTVFPRVILIRGNYLSNVDLSGCTKTSSSYICNEDTSSPMSLSVFNCARGDLKECARTRVTTSHVSRFALLDGVLFANCLPISCRCSEPEFGIVQDTKTSNIMVDQSYCKEILIDNIFITLGNKKLNRSIFAMGIEVGGSVSVDPIDVGNELAGIQDTISESEDKLNEAISILNRVNPNIINTSTGVYLIVISVVVVIWLLILTCLFIKFVKLNSRNQVLSNQLVPPSTANSMTQLIPTVYN
ncbi:fusion protein [Wufeng Typhlomys cinereus jeilongvirus 1]|uniref:Fusion glycoprotein F0 n=1 Tax=Wufeng Typhlomys cinereus jeilongvirus 1 TaxID=2928989 RepID=A0A8T9KQ74_9MONO|nr:fusion protein [Wufeng Typhlomys cinereus jeilongvirus 1]